MKKIPVTNNILKTFKDGIGGRPEGTKGRENTVACLGLLRSIEKADGKEYLYVEAAEYKFLKGSIETCPWLSNEKALNSVEAAWDAIDKASQYNPNADEKEQAPAEDKATDKTDQKTE